MKLTKGGSHPPTHILSNSRLLKFSSDKFILRASKNRWRGWRVITFSTNLPFYEPLYEIEDFSSSFPSLFFHSFIFNIFSGLWTCQGKILFLFSLSIFFAQNISKLWPSSHYCKLVMIDLLQVILCKNCCIFQIFKVTST